MNTSGLLISVFLFILKLIIITYVATTLDSLGFTGGFCQAAG